MDTFAHPFTNSASFTKLPDGIYTIGSMPVYDGQDEIVQEAVLFFCVRIVGHQVHPYRPETEYTFLEGAAESILRNGDYVVDKYDSHRKYLVSYRQDESTLPAAISCQ